MIRSHGRLLWAFRVLLVMPAMLTAQCGPVPLPVPPFPGGSCTSAVVWDPDGAGPAGPALATAQLQVSPTLRTRLRGVDLATGTWSLLPGEIDGQVLTLAALSNGDLVCAGDFTGVDGSPMANIARWNGSGWQALGTGVDGDVQALAVLPNGDVVAGGHFTTAGGVAAAHIARWDGSAWHNLGTGVDQTPFALLTAPNGDLIAGGIFTTAGGIATGGLARWDGIGWHVVDPLATGVFALAFDNNGVLHAAWENKVHSIAAGGTTTVAIFDSTVAGIAFAGNGDLLVGGKFEQLLTPLTIPARHLARRSGQTWSAMPDGGGAFQWPDLFFGFVPLPNGQMAVLGLFVAESGRSNNVVRWDGATWGVFGQGLDGPVSRILEEPNGDAIVAGWFRFAGGADVGGLARWDGQAFTPLGGGTNNSVGALARAPNGDVLVGGNFTTIGGIAANKVARWNGASWSPLPGLGHYDHVSAMLALPNGEIIAGGTFYLGGSYGCALWNGTTWSPLGTLEWVVFDLVRRSNGEVVAIGWEPVSAHYQVRSWYGAAWNMLGTADGDLNTALILPNGDVLVGGSFSSIAGVPASRVARWNGAAWSAVGAPPQTGVYSLCMLPDGDLLAGGWFFGSAAAPRLQRWDGAGWTPYGPPIGGSAYTALSRADGSLRIGIDYPEFDPSGGTFAEFAPACPSTASAYGSGCAGSGGTNVLAIETLPWLGGTFAARSTGMPANGLVLAAYGFQPVQVPLLLLSPLALPGCSGLVLPEWFDVVAPVSGAARSVLAVPAAAALIGGTFFHQHVPLELDAFGNLTAITSSNGLRLQIGAL